MHRVSAVLLSVAAGQLFGSASSSNIQSLLVEVLLHCFKIKLTSFARLQYVEVEILWSLQ